MKWKKKKKKKKKKKDGDKHLSNKHFFVYLLLLFLLFLLFFYTILSKSFIITKLFSTKCFAFSWNHYRINCIYQNYWDTLTPDHTCLKISTHVVVSKILQDDWQIV